MQVKNIMRQNIKFCRPHDFLNVPAQIFWEYNCGCAPVVDADNKVLAMITDRDVCNAAYTQGKRLGEIPVSTAMSKTVITCRPEETHLNAVRLMKTNQIRRLPVTDAEGRLVGLLSLNDLAQEAERERKWRKKEVSDAEIGETLAAVCRPLLAEETLAAAS